MICSICKFLHWLSQLDWLHFEKLGLVDLLNLEFLRLTNLTRLTRKTGLTNWLHLKIHKNGKMFWNCQKLDYGIFFSWFILSWKLKIWLSGLLKDKILEYEENLVTFEKRYHDYHFKSYRYWRMRAKKLSETNYSQYQNLC